MQAIQTILSSTKNSFQPHRWRWQACGDKGRMEPNACSRIKTKHPTRLNDPSAAGVIYRRWWKRPVAINVCFMENNQASRPHLFGKLLEHVRRITLKWQDEAANDGVERLVEHHLGGIALAER